MEKFHYKEGTRVNTDPGGHRSQTITIDSVNALCSPECSRLLRNLLRA